MSVVQWKKVTQNFLKKTNYRFLAVYWKNEMVWFNEWGYFEFAWNLLLLAIV